jgi:hypothetical protein
MQMLLNVIYFDCEIISKRINYNIYYIFSKYINILFINLLISILQNNGAQQLASEATVYIMLEDVNDEIPLFTEREQETVLEGEPVGTKVTQVNAIDKDGTFPNNQVR